MKLSDVSPLAAMVTGQGAMGKAMSQGFGGMIPAAIAKSAREQREEEEREAEEREAAKRQGVATMKKGGSVKGWGKARGARAAKIR